MPVSVLELTESPTTFTATIMKSYEAPLTNPAVLVTEYSVALGEMALVNRAMALLSPCLSQ